MKRHTRRADQVSDKKEAEREFFDALASRHPLFWHAVTEDARVSMGHRGEADRLVVVDGHTQFGSTWAAVREVVRLSWISDAFFAQVLYRLRTRCIARHVPVLPSLLHHLSIAIAQVSISRNVLMHPGICIAHGQVVVDGLTEIKPGTLLTPWITIGVRAGAFGGPIIGPNAKLGTGCRVLGDVTVGAGASVGANAVVVKDVPDGATAVGVPARIVTAN